MDKTRGTYMKEFCIILNNGAPERKTRLSSVLFSSVGWVLGSPQCFRSSISLSYGCGKANIELNGSSQRKIKNGDQEKIQSDLMQ